MNKSGQFGAIGLIFIDVFFLINWGLWLGSWLATVGDQAISANSLTGIEAFVFGNLNLIVFVGLLLMNLIYFTIGGER